MHSCHTSAKNVTKLAVSSATHVSGQTAKKSSRKPPPFFVKTSATPIGENEKN